MAKNSWGRAYLRVNNYVADASFTIAPDGKHVYTAVISKIGQRELVEGPAGRSAAAFARMILNQYEAKAKGRRK